MPLLNVLSEARALVSWTMTFFQSFSRFPCACLSVLPCFLQEPYAAMMFQRAPPDVNGFGVTTSTPGRMRSFQLLIFFGLPSRTTKTTTEFVTIPLYDCFFHAASTFPAATSSSTSGARESATMSASRPALTARVCSPEEPYDCVKSTSLPAAVFWNAGMSFPYASRGVEYATRFSFVSAEPSGAADPMPAVVASATASTLSVTITDRAFNLMLLLLVEYLD